MVWTSFTDAHVAVCAPASMPLTHLCRAETRSGLSCSRVCLQQRRNASYFHFGARCTIPHGLFARKSATTHRSPLTNPLPVAGRPSFVLISPAMSSTQVRSHSGHSHGQSHVHDNLYLVSSNKKDAGVRITRIGLLVNLSMAIGKGIGGYFFHSQALIADGFHALTDLVSDVMTLATISWSLKPPTARFPSGYGKIESLGALGVSSLLLFGGIGMGFNGLDALYSQFFVDTAAVASEHAEHAHGLLSFLGHSHGHGPTLPDINAAWLAAGSIVVKEWLYRASEY